MKKLSFVKKRNIKINDSLRDSIFYFTSSVYNSNLHNNHYTSTLNMQNV